MRVDRDFREMVAGYGLTTTETLYTLPDYPHIVQSLVWQTLDSYPQFPRVKNYFRHWLTLPCVVQKFTICHARLIAPCEIKTNSEFLIH